MEIQILFSTPMVQAIPNGKTQTRRTRNLKTINQDPDRYELLGMRTTKKGLHVLFKDKITGGIFLIKSPYGKPGDILWAKETWAKTGDNFHDDWPGHGEYYYKADNPFNEIELHKNYPQMKGWPKWRPSIFMPKAAARTWLKITDVRVERLQDISEADAIAEGIEEDGGGFKAYDIIHSGPHKGEPDPWNCVPNASPITSYHELWESINGDGSWKKNPYVWVITFEQIKKIIENGQK